MDQVNSALSVDSYVEYKRIVGDDDGGVTFEPKQYEEYIQRIKPMRFNNRIYVSWSNSEEVDCKLVGPETECFCQHRYKEHKTDFEEIPGERPIPQPCKVAGCGCSCYHYVPQHRNQAIKCRCKHFSYDHEAAQPYKCSYDTCSCEGFTTSHTCACGQSAKQHRTVTETKQERLGRGHPVGKDTLYQAMGGLTGFSSMLDGYVRLDNSGAGPPPDHVLEEAITCTDHPFLRANVHSIAAYKHAVGAPEDEVNADLAERMSQMRRPGESELAFYERRYKERQQSTKRLAVKPKKGLTAPRPGGNQSPLNDPTSPDMGLSINQPSHSKASTSQAPRRGQNSPKPGAASGGLGRQSQGGGMDMGGLAISGTGSVNRGMVGGKKLTKK